jgi:HEAT repeat protein
VFGTDYTIGPPHYRTEVGAHENSESAYGTFDQGGNVQEFNETAAPSAGRALFRFTAPESPGWARAKAAFWLGATRGEEALERLHEMAREDSSDEVRDQAVFAISISDVPGSEAILIDLPRNDSRPDTRSKALFWLSQEAGERIPDTLRDAVENDPSVEVKEQAVFALSQLPPERGIPLLIDIARSEKRHPDVRRAAMFWLGQSGDPRALEFFEEVLK